MIRLIIIGFSGRLGQEIYAAAAQRPQEFSVVAGVDPVLPTDAPIPVYTDINQVSEKADGVIDFSRPDAIYQELPYCKEHGLFAIIGTTALTESDNAFVDSFARYIPIFRSRNMSLGVNLQLELVKNAASTLGLAFEPEIVEKHHHMKVDAPSGTALMLAEEIKAQYNEDVKCVYGRYTKTERRRPNELGIHSVRGGTIVGEHECYFIGTDEILEINHRAYSKQVFAQGALRAAAFLHGKLPGIYSMKDIVMDTNVVSRLYAKDGQSVVMVQGLKKNALSRIFDALADRDIFVDMISLSSFGEVGFSIDERDIYTAVSLIEEQKTLFPDLNVRDINGMTKITIEGLGMESSSGIAAQIFDILDNVHIDPALVSTSEAAISIAIDTELVQTALKALSDHLDL